MKYLATVNQDELSNTMRVFGDGEKMQKQCLSLLNWAVKNKNKPTSIGKISDATGIPKMNIHWIISDASIRKQKSTLARTSREHGFNYEIDSKWRTENKHERTKRILKVKKKN